MTTKTACVVGAGAAGIAALKECRRQGFEPVCFELDSDIGGIWLQKNASASTNTPSIWDSLITNSSKYNTCFSDLPHPLDATLFQPAQEIYDYLKRAIEYYKLQDYIRFNTKVIKIRKTNEHDQTGQWEVYTTGRDSQAAGDGQQDDQLNLSNCERHVFDLVLVCTGYFKLPNYPDVPGLDSFNGKVQHSFYYKNPTEFQGKSVLVVGNKFSAMDLASEIANNAKMVHLAVGDGTWILRRCVINNSSIDTALSRSLLYSTGGVVTINDKLIQEAEHNINHLAVGIRPSKPPLISSFGLSDELPIKILSGKVAPCGHLSHVEGSQVHFKDGQVIREVDAILFCTGYKPCLSFIDMEIIQADGKMDLYRMTFPLDQKHNTLALIGQISGDFPLFVCYELQARLATRVMAGKQQLPPYDVMRKDAEFWSAETLARRGNYHSYFVSVAVLNDLIAGDIGCYPSFWKVLLKDPVLAYRNWYGIMLNAQYRLIGPDSNWEEASRLCYRLYNEIEGCSEGSPMKKLYRKDVDALFRTRVFWWAKVSLLTSAICVLLCREQQIFTAVRAFWHSSI